MTGQKLSEVMIKKFETGLVIGKFFPLHKGHQYLIDTALEQVKELTILC